MITIEAIIKSDHLMSDVISKYNNVLSSFSQIYALAMELCGKLHISCSNERDYDDVRSLLLTTTHIAHVNNIEIEIVEILYFGKTEE